MYVGGDRNDAEVLGIEKMIQRTASATHSAVTFMHVPNLLAGANASASATSASGIAFLQHLTAVMNGPLTIADKIEDYFCGPAAFPMRCARIVVPLNKVVLLGVARGVGGDGGIGAAAQQFRAVRIDPARHARDLVGRICAVSLATVEAEAAFANVAGVVLIDSVHVPENELVLFVPAGGDGASDTCLVRPFLLVGDESLRYSGAAVEACSV